jgi:prephenate dehydratase
MAYKIRRIDYYNTKVKDEPGAAYELLSLMAQLGINLLAFTAIPVGNQSAQLTLFPDEHLDLEAKAKTTGLNLDGPHPAILVRGDDELGALTQIHEKLYRAGINIFASNGITDGSGSYCYLVYIRPEDYQRAAEVLDIS